MSLIDVEKAELKELIKESIREVIQEEEDEDAALGKLLEEGDTGEYSSRDEVFNILNGIK
jgi:hypothetical protein